MQVVRVSDKRKLLKENEGATRRYTKKKVSPEYGPLPVFRSSGWSTGGLSREDKGKGKRTVA